MGPSRLERKRGDLRCIAAVSPLSRRRVVSLEKLSPFWAVSLFVAHCTEIVSDLFSLAFTARIVTAASAHFLSQQRKGIPRYSNFNSLVGPTFQTGSNSFTPKRAGYAGWAYCTRCP